MGLERTSQWVVAASLWIVSACAKEPQAPPNQPVGAIPEVQQANASWHEASVFVSIPDSADLRLQVERAFLKAGAKVTKTPEEATIVVTFGDAGDSYSNSGIKGGVSFNSTRRSILATATAGGRLVAEAKAASEFTVTNKEDEEFAAFTRRTAEQSSASFQLIANSIVNQLLAKEIPTPAPK